jgi:hypothetical protein
MVRDARMEAAAATRKRIKWTAVVGLFLFFGGGASTFASGLCRARCSSFPAAPPWWGFS